VPLIGEFQGKFWSISDTAVPPALAPGFGGYPVWQASVVASSLPLGPVGAFLDAVIARVRWWIRLLRGVRALTPNQRAAVQEQVVRFQRGAGPLVQVVERVIEKPVERVVEVDRIIEKPVDRVVEKTVDVVREVTRVDLRDRIVALDPERTAVLTRSLDLLESPHYVVAQQAVRKTATTLGFDRPEAWKDLTRHMKEDLGRTQNVYRHLKAMRLLRDAANSTFTNPEANFLTELAYQGFSAMGK
jgi:hypothetical protein